MNKNLIFKLSLFGLAMAFATVFFIPSKIEPFCWIAIFIICAYLIAKNCIKFYFLNGLCVSLVNCVWITSAHILLFDTYMANNPQEAAIMKNIPMTDSPKSLMLLTGIIMKNTPMNDSPKLLMLLTGIVFGIVSGLLLGLLAFFASKIMTNKQL